jgi:hypothetical protein
MYGYETRQCVPLRAVKNSDFTLEVRMNFAKFLVLAGLVSLSNLAFAGQVRHFTADAPGVCDLGGYIYDSRGWFDQGATEAAARRCCKQYSVNAAFNKAVRDCSSSIGNVAACKNAYYTQRTIYSDAAVTHATCNVEVTLTVERGGWR